MLRVRYASHISDDERAAVQVDLRHGLTEANRILPDQSRVKSFYRIETPLRPLFVKVRTFFTLGRRLGRTIRKTKEAKEFENYLALRSMGIPCPEPIGSGRIYRGPLVERSLLIMDYLDAISLKDLLTQKNVPPEPLMDQLLGFMELLRDKGIIHKDFQWNNILVSSGLPESKFFLVDALHIRLSPVTIEDFSTNIDWFVRFMIMEGAPGEVIDAFLDRLKRLDLPVEHDCWRVRQQAGRHEAKLVLSGSLPEEKT